MNTYDFYVNHRFVCSAVEEDLGGWIGFTKTTFQRRRECLGEFLDQIPTLENFKILWEKLASWVKDGSYLSDNRDDDRDHLFYVLLNVIRDVSNDIDPEILRFIVQELHKNKDPYIFYIESLKHPRCPSDLLDVEIDNPKLDPCSNTKGGEKYVFILMNDNLSESQVLRILQKCRKTGTQSDSLEKPYMTYQTYKYLVEHGRSEAVKRDALLLMYKKGLIKV